MIAGPGGVGKSTLLSAGLKHGEIATADNLCACDSRTAYGLVEPLRVAGRPGGARPRRMAAAKYPLPGRVPQPGAGPAGGTPPRRGRVERTTLRPLVAGEAARELVAGTYMAGELRRFWSFAGTLALATGIGPAHPDVSGIAAALADAAALPGSAGGARLAGADR